MLCSCKKDDNSDGNLSKNPPKTPEPVNYDLNDDSVDDIKIEYSWFTWDGINCSGEGISGSLEPLSGSSVLSKRNDYTLFNKLNDTIKINTNEPYYWEKYSNSVLITIMNSTENDYLWQNEWSVRSGMTLDTYYLGIKLNVNDNNLVGWIRIKINKLTGGIQVLEKKFTTEEFIVVGK